MEADEDKYQWAIAGLKLMSVEQKLMALEVMELQMSPEEWRKFQEKRYLGILEEIMDQRRVAEHQKRDLETMVQAEMEVKARPVEQSTEPPVIQEEMKEVFEEEKSKEVAEHLLAEKLEFKEEREASEEEMKEVSDEEMKEAAEEEQMKENTREMVRNSRVKQVWRPWEEERVAEVSGLVEVVAEKEEVAEHLSDKLETHDGTQYPTPCG